MDDLIIPKLPDWANWVAQDNDGSWYVFGGKPIKDTDCLGLWNSTRDDTGTHRFMKLCTTEPLPNSMEVLINLEELRKNGL